MKIREIKIQLKISPNGGLLAWFEKKIVITRKGEIATDMNKPVMPNVDRVFAERDLWLNEERVYSFALILLFQIHNPNPKLWQLGLGLIFSAIPAYLTWLEINREKAKEVESVKASKTTLDTLARMEAEEAAKRIPQRGKAKTTYDKEHRVIDWGDPNNQDRIPIEELKDKNHINYYKNFSYNFLASQQKLWDRGSWASNEFLNFYKSWNKHKGWGREGFCPYREDIKKLVAFDLADWDEPVTITLPI